jgi:hypothetical protein
LTLNLEIQINPNRLLEELSLKILTPTKKSKRLKLQSSFRLTSSDSGLRRTSIVRVWTASMM